MENGRSSVSFHNDSNPSSSRAFHVFKVPPCEPGDNPKDNSVIIPPFHAHPKQEEVFLVTSGTALFCLNRTQILVSAGNEITIPRGDYHKFGNASSTETLTLEGWYNPAEPAREERFFRNLYGYLNDATAGGVGATMLGNASIAQIALFAWEADMPICEPSKLPRFNLVFFGRLFVLVVALGIPKVIGIPIAYGLTWLLGVFVGKWMLGYKASYDEYYHESSG
jgi:mannose-6-phosphate isomerase-like protein (cupin superfamily)